MYVYKHNFKFRLTYDVGIINKTGNVRRLQRDIETLYWFHCCSRKAINITCSECVFLFVALVIQHAMRIRYICHLWPVRLYSIFPHYLINGKILGK